MRFFNLKTFVLGLLFTVTAGAAEKRTVATQTGFYSEYAPAAIGGDREDVYTEEEGKDRSCCRLSENKKMIAVAGCLIAIEWASLYWLSKSIHKWDPCFYPCYRN